MATINRRGDSWQLNWSQSGVQHRQTLGTITPHEAKIALREKELELAGKLPLTFPSIAFEDFLDIYLNWHASEWPDSHERIRQICEQHFADFNGKPLSQIDTLAIEGWKGKRLKEDVARSTVEKELRTLKAVFNKAVQWDKLNKNPAEHVSPPKNLESEPPHWFIKEELEALYNFYHGPIWRLLANTGLRRGEVLQLRPEHVAEDHLKVCSTTSARTKSGRWRQVPLSSNGKAAVIELLAQNEHTGFVIPHIRPPSLSRAAANDVDTLEIGGSLHSFRHSYGAHACMAGVPLRTLQKLMGHASIKTTEIYAHIADEYLKRHGAMVNI
jgi:integrase